MLWVPLGVELCVCVRVRVCMCMCVCLCLCMRQRDKKREYLQFRVKFFANCIDGPIDSFVCFLVFS